MLLTLVCGAVAACSRAPRLAADLVVTHASVWTGDAARPEAEAIAVIGERIVAVGTTDDIDRLRGADTVVVDAEGRRVVPGFNDAFVHFVAGGMQLDQVDLTDAGTEVEFARRIAERAKARRGEWILGGSWDEQRWTPSRLPTRQLIDDSTNGTPVFVTHRGGRKALANSTVLGRAGISEQTPDPPGGTIVRDAHGMPTGVLQDAAMALVKRVIPPAERSDKMRAVKRALAHAASFGVTSVQDMNASDDDIAVYAELNARRELTARIYAAPPEAGWYDQAKLGVRRSFGSPWLRIGVVGAVVDALPSSGPAEEMPPLEQIRTRLMAADHAGLQLCLQATSEAGLAQIVDIASAIVRANGERDRRLLLVYAGAIAAGDVDRVAPLGLIASLRPQQAASSELRTLVDKGVRIAMSSDWYAGPLNPMPTVSAAILDPAPSQRLTIQEAVAAYTRGSAFAEFQDAEKGTIARGQLADLAILSDDIFTMPAARVKDVTVLTTIAGGKVVHQRRP